MNFADYLKQTSSKIWLDFQDEEYEKRCQLVDQKHALQRERNDAMKPLLKEEAESSATLEKANFAQEAAMDPRIDQNSTQQPARLDRHADGCWSNCQLRNRQPESSV